MEDKLQKIEEYVADLTEYLKKKADELFEAGNCGTMYAQYVGSEAAAREILLKIRQAREDSHMTHVHYELEACVITFLEVKEGTKPFFMKRKFKDEMKAKQFVFDLLNSDRVVANIQFKTNYNVNKKEAQYE